MTHEKQKKHEPSPGAALRDWRKHNEYSQESLAQELQVSLYTIRNIEQGRTQVSRMMRRLVELYCKVNRIAKPNGW